jgi:hypothetical protein
VLLNCAWRVTTYQLSAVPNNWGQTHFSRSPLRHRVDLLSRVWTLACIFAACARGTGDVIDSAATDIDSVAIDTAAPPPPPAPRRLSPAADSIAQRLVFVPANQSWFTAAARAKRLLVDIGRVDVPVNQPPSRLAAYREAVAARSPLQPDTRLRVAGPWGADDATVAGFDVWNGRIVATLKTEPRVDSLARSVDPLVATVQRADSGRPPTYPTCVRGPADSALVKRLTALRDSLLKVLREGDQPVYQRFVASLRERSSHVVGCFDTGKAVLVVALVAGDYEWVRERALLVAADGKATPLGIRDFRFRAHDLLAALDADEDGKDEVAARSYTERGGGTVVLRIVDGKRLERLTGGFSYER